MEKDNYERTGQAGHQRESAPFWFLVVAALVVAWVAYYVCKYWGGLGPGLGY